MSLIEQVNAGIMSSMKAKEQDRLRALRGIKSAFLLLKTAEGVSEVTDDMCVKALQKMAKQRKDSLDIYVQQGREDLAVIERAELAVIEAFLPAQMSAEEIETQVKAIIAETGAAGMKDLGKVMPAAMKAMGAVACPRFYPNHSLSTLYSDELSQVIDHNPMWVASVAIVQTCSLDRVYNTKLRPFGPPTAI